MVGIPASTSSSGLATRAHLGTGVFRQVDRREKADRHRHQQRDEGDVERAPEKRQMPSSDPPPKDGDHVVPKKNSEAG